MNASEVNEFREVEERANKLGFTIGSNNFNLWIDKEYYDKTYWFDNIHEVKKFLEGWEARIIYCDAKE